MRSIRLQRARRIRFVGAAIGFAALVVLGVFVSAMPDAVAATPATINPGQVPTTSAGYPVDCGQGPGWVFVLPASQGDAFVSISATFQSAGVVAGTVASNNKFAYVNVPLTDTLITATAMIDGGHEGSTFNLTHVCNQGVVTTTTTTTTVPSTTTSTSTSTSTSTTSTSTSTSTTLATTTTTTEAPTTTTTIGTQTTVPQTTTTTEAPTTTTTEAPTTTTTEAPTTTSTVVVQTTLPPTTTTEAPTTTTIPTTTSTDVEGSTTSAPETTTTTIGGQGSTITTATTVPVVPNDTPTTQANSSGSGALPFTGSGSGPLALFALAAIAAGGILASRRRTAAR